MYRLVIFFMIGLGVIVGCASDGSREQSDVVMSKALNNSAMALTTKRVHGRVPYDSVLTLLTKAIDKDSSNRVAWMNKTTVYANTQNYRGMVTTLKAWLKRRPSDPQARMRLAAAYRMRGDSLLARQEYKRSLSEYRDVLKSNPDSLFLNQQVALLIARVEGRKRAIEYIDSLSQASPSDSSFVLLRRVVKKDGGSILY